MNFDDEVEKAINNNMESEEEIAYEYQENEELEQEHEEICLKNNSPLKNPHLFLRISLNTLFIVIAVIKIVVNNFV